MGGEDRKEKEGNDVHLGVYGRALGNQLETMRGGGDTYIHRGDALSSREQRKGGD